MKSKKLTWAATAASLLASATFATTGKAQQSEALLEVLVKKGILTEQEAEDLKADLAKENKQYVKVRSAGKETIALDIYGDMRARMEGFYSDDPEIVDRTRFRYRLRLGMTATLFDRFEAGLRLASGDLDSGIGAGLDPISSNQSLQNNASRKGIFIDLAYGRFYAFTNETAMSALTLGKMENPFTFSDMVFDGDYTPEGAGLTFGYNPSADHALKLNLGAFVLDEIGGQSEDAYMVGAQARWDGTWLYDEAHKAKLQSSAGIAVLAIGHGESLTNNAVPNVNRGNTRLPGTGELAYHYNPIVADAGLTYTFEKAPLYNGAFPIRLAGDFIYNPAAPNDNRAYSVGVTFGKSGKRGTWDLSYRWKYLEADAWFEEVTDSDFGAFYQVAQPEMGTGTGYFAGTNVKGHVFKLSYSPYNSMTLSATWLKTKLIDEPAGGSDSDMNRVQVDALWKF
jgi:polyhydroxyalkanoate synthesis regulator phasin